MTEKERKELHNKGVFSVTQLSYTFRARRKPKRFASQPDKHSHSLRALAIREKKVHIAGKPELMVKGTPVYLDVEGIPDREFYYLIGMRVKSGESYIQHSFWANDTSEEKEIWVGFLQALTEIESPQLIHFGSYERVFLKRMKEGYGKAVNNPEFLDKLITESVNILSAIYAQIYFPTYSNGLKDVAHYLGFQWSDRAASGFNSLIWRSNWEWSRNPTLKQKLITYNTEDCQALEKVTQIIARLCQTQSEVLKPENGGIVYADSLQRKNLYHLGEQKFSLPELESINRAAYWDYQREKVYVRSSKRLQRVSEKGRKDRAKTVPVNKIIKCPASTCCPECGATMIYRYGKRAKVVYDIKFGRASTAWLKWLSI